MTNKKEKNGLKIEIEVSLENEYTASPYWLILDPTQNMRCDIHELAGSITGVFFSREEAQEVLDGQRYNYSDKAVVYCLSGHNTIQYSNKYQEGERREETK